MNRSADPVNERNGQWWYSACRGGLVRTTADNLVQRVVTFFLCSSGPRGPCGPAGRQAPVTDDDEVGWRGVLASASSASRPCENLLHVIERLRLLSQTSV